MKHRAVSDNKKTDFGTLKPNVRWPAIGTGSFKATLRDVSKCFKVKKRKRPGLFERSEFPGHRFDHLGNMETAFSEPTEPIQLPPRKTPVFSF